MYTEDFIKIAKDLPENSVVSVVFVAEDIKDSFLELVKGNSGKLSNFSYISYFHTDRGVTIHKNKEALWNNSLIVLDEHDRFKS